MTLNVGTADRAIRYALGLLLVLSPLWNDYVFSFAPWIVALMVIVGIVLTVTAYFRSCLAYSILGVSTRQK